MSNKGSNKGIYIFWGSIALIIVVVLLVLFLPRVNTVSPLYHANDVATNLEKVDQNSHDITYFSESFLNDQATNENLKNELQSLFNLQQTFQRSQAFCQTALLYIEPASDYATLAKQQTADFHKLRTNLADFQAYCTNFITPLFNGTPYSDRPHVLNQTLNVYNQKYKEFINCLSDFYFTTAKIIDSSATTCMEVNATMKEKHLELMTTTHAMVSDDFYALGNTTTALANAIILYAEGYYKSFI